MYTDTTYIYTTYCRFTKYHVTQYLLHTGIQHVRDTTDNSLDTTCIWDITCTWIQHV